MVEPPFCTRAAVGPPRNGSRASRRLACGHTQRHTHLSAHALQSCKCTRIQHTCAPTALQAPTHAYRGEPALWVTPRGKTAGGGQQRGTARGGGQAAPWGRVQADGAACPCPEAAGSGARRGEQAGWVLYRDNGGSFSYSNWLSKSSSAWTPPEEQVPRARDQALWPAGSVGAKLHPHILQSHPIPPLPHYSQSGR